MFSLFQLFKWFWKILETVITLILEWFSVNREKKKTIQNNSSADDDCHFGMSFLEWCIIATFRLMFHCNLLFHFSNGKVHYLFFSKSLTTSFESMKFWVSCTEDKRHYPILGIVCLHSFFNYFLSKKREVVPDLAPMLWHSFGKQLSLNQVFLRKTFCMPSFKCLLDVKYTDKPNQMLLQCKEVLWLKQTPDDTLWCLYKGPWIWLIKQLYWTCYGHSCYF